MSKCILDEEMILVPTSPFCLLEKGDKMGSPDPGKWGSTGPVGSIMGLPVSSLMGPFLYLKIVFWGEELEACERRYTVCDMKFSGTSFTTMSIGSAGYIFSPSDEFHEVNCSSNILSSFENKG